LSDAVSTTHGAVRVAASNAEAGEEIVRSVNAGRKLRGDRRSKIARSA
jgi:hypothetical protein